MSDQSPAGLDRALEQMLTTLTHRGPDHGATITTERAGLGHRRLSILDRTEAGNQPMRRGNTTVVTNGEIYNFRSLAAQHNLEAQLSSRTDTEVLAWLIDQVGIERTVEALNGMYAFAAWDSRGSVLHLVRDPWGVKPMFVARHNGVLWFASEIKPLLLIPGFNRRPNREALHHYLSFDYIPGAYTAFEGIEEVRPGAWWTIDTRSGAVTMKSHQTTRWHTNSTLTEADAVRASHDLLLASVERQLVADVEVGVMLSGGIDSSAIAALVKHVRGDADFHTFSIGFDDASFDEGKHARRVADHLGTRHHHIQVSSSNVAKMLPTYLGSIQEPYADGSAIPTALLAAEARHHVTVLLSGEGGDEFFTGYDTHAAATARRLYRALPSRLRQAVIAPMVSMLPVSHRKLSFDFKAKRFVHGAEFSDARAHFAWREVLSEEAKAALVARPEDWPTYPPSYELFEDAWRSCGSDSPIHKMLHVDRTYHLPDDLMVKNDRMTMAASLETRVPFCDRALVDFLATVPPHYLMWGLQPKALLRKAMAPYLPESILKRKKMGLEMPYSRWMRGDLVDDFTAILSEERISRTELLRPEGVMKLADQHRDLVCDHGRALWGIANFVLWHELFIQSEDFIHATAMSSID